MSYTPGSLITAADYNSLAGNVNTTWATAYGQTPVATISPAATVTATQWATLNTTVSSMAAHQGTTITSRTNPTAGNLISVLANLTTDIANCATNVANAATVGTQYTAWTGTASKTTSTGSGGSPWTITFTDTVTFANATAANTFFNGGGLVKVQFSKTSTGTSEDVEWNQFINTTCGTIFLSGTGNSKTINGTTYTGTTKVGGTGTPTTLATSTGYAQLTGTPTTIYKQFDTGAAYSSNYVQLDASVANSVITLTTTWFNAGAAVSAVISGGTPTTGIAFGTAPTTVVTYTPPETTNLTNVWGTPTVASTVA